MTGVIKGWFQNYFYDRDYNCSDAFARSKFLRVMDCLALLFLSLYIGECAIGSSGRWLEVGGLSIRMILFIIAFVFCLPNLWIYRKELIKNKYIWLLCAFAVWMIVCAFIGLDNGNRQSFVVKDITSFLSLSLFPGFLATVRNNKRITLLTDVLFYAASFLSLLVLLIHLTIPFNLYNLIEFNDFINKLSLGGLATMSTGLQRIYFKSQIFVQISILIGIWKILTQKKRRWFLIIATGILVFALIVSYTRGFWLGLAVSFLFFAVFLRSYWKQYIKTLGLVFLVFLVLLTASWAVYQKPVAAVTFVERFNPRLVVFLPNVNVNSGGVFIKPSSPEESADISAATLRVNTLNEHVRLSKQKPVLGWGLGKNMDSLRNDGKTEYMYWDILLKMGGIGLVLFMAIILAYPVKLIAWHVSKRRQRSDLNQRMPIAGSVVLAFTYVCALLGVMITSYVNPYLSTPLGISLLLCTAAAVNLACKKGSEEDTGFPDSKSE